MNTSHIHTKIDQDDLEVYDDGDLTDLLGELRVLLPSSQLLSAFLITVPFMPGFNAIAYTEKWVFLADISFGSDEPSITKRNCRTASIDTTAD